MPDHTTIKNKNYFHSKLMDYLNKFDKVEALKLSRLILDYESNGYELSSTEEFLWLLLTDKIERS